MTQNSPMNHDQPEADDLLEALARANPVDDLEAPTANSPEAQALLERVMEQPASETQHQHPGLRPAAAVAPLAAVGSSQGGESEVPMIDAYASGSARGFGRSRGMLVAAAAAVVLIALTALTLVPINTPSALAQVQSAAAATDGSRSGRIDSVFTVQGSEVDDGQEIDLVELAGSVAMLYRGDDLQLSVDLDSLSFGPVSDPASESASESNDELDGDLDELMAFVDDIRLVDGVVYVQPDGDEWIAFDTNGLLSGLLSEVISDRMDPRDPLANLQELTEATEIGDTTLDGPLDGLSGTHFQSGIDRGDESVTSSGWAPFDASELLSDADGEIMIDIYVDDEDLLRRLVVSGDLSEAGTEPGSQGSGTFEIETNFSDLGDNVTIEAPAGAVEFSPGFFDELSEEVSA